ncbi:MAG TPA: hypothetical protein VFS64_06115 [Solirubrobacterales bacterium]|nr:hypothetical protein [Solirubrobacterales bacterium]
MNDDWRLQIDFVDEGPADALHDKLDARELEHDLSNAFHDRVIASRNGTTIFLYAGDRDQAEKARDLVERLTREDGEEVEVDFRRWHPEAEEWRPADEPLPAGAAAKVAEHAARVAHERKECEERGYPEWEVRVNLPSHKEAGELAERLRSEGLPNVHRWKYVLVGATDEDSANQLAERIRDGAPTGSSVAIEGTWRAAYAGRPHTPFSFLGGLAE